MLGVGRVCAENLEEDYVAAGQREKRAQSKVRRRTTWMQAKWKMSCRGNAYINRNGFNIVLYRRFRGWARGVCEPVRSDDFMPKLSELSDYDKPDNFGIKR